MKKLLPFQLSFFILALLFGNAVLAQAPPDPGNDPLAETYSVAVVMAKPVPGDCQKTMTVSASIEILKQGSVSIGSCNCSGNGEE